MLSRVFKNRLPKILQIRQFCQPNTSKNEALYKKIQSDPKLEKYFETLKNDPNKNDLDAMKKYEEEANKKEEEDGDFIYVFVIFMLIAMISIKDKKQKRKKMIENNKNKRKHIIE